MSEKNRTRQPQKRHCPRHGDGSFYFREADQRWVGTFEAGDNAKGKRRRVVVTDKDENRAWDKYMTKRKILLTEGRAAALQRSITVAAWIDRWLPIQERCLRPGTYAGSASYCRRWIVPTVGRVRLEDVTAAHVRKVADAARAAGRSTTTAGTIQGVFQKLLRDAQVEGYQVSESALKVERPSKSNTRQRAAIPLDQAWLLIDAALQRDGGARWLMAFIQGMRPAEVLGLRWDAIDFERGLVDVSWQLKTLPYRVKRDRSSGFRIPDGYEIEQLELGWHLVRPKSAAGQRLIPLVPWMKEQLQSWQKVAPMSPHGLVFPRPDGRPRVDKADVAEWRAIQDAAGVWKTPAVGDTPAVYWDSYEIRHSTATLLLAAGVDPVIIEAIMGHSDILVTKTYQHVDTAMMRKALESVAEKLKERPSLAGDAVSVTVEFA